MDISETIVVYDVKVGFLIQCWIKTLLHQSLSELEFCGDLVYKFKKL